ncbi:MULTISPECIES: autotransporter outer membrane beta-barrel domain-containing protein [unclassified Pseudomonas]|nr:MULTISPECIES: autotransporter outer membrane beta-barrel domain-containing protein [unclassified Pseudomonas]
MTNSSIHNVFPHNIPNGSVSSTAGPMLRVLSMYGRIPLACLFAFSGQGILSASAFAYSTPAIEMDLSVSSTEIPGAAGTTGTTGAWDSTTLSQLSASGGDGANGGQSTDGNSGSPVGQGAAGSAGVLTQTNNGGDGGDGGAGGNGADKLHLVGGSTGSGGKGGNGGAGADGVQGGKGGNGGNGGKGGANGATNVLNSVGDRGDGGNGGDGGKGGAGVQGGLGGNGTQGAIGGETLDSASLTLTGNVSGMQGGDGGQGGQGQDGGQGGTGGQAGGLGALNFSPFGNTPMNANGGNGGNGGDGGDGGKGGKGGNGADGGNGFEINHTGVTVSNSGTIIGGKGGAAGLGGAGGAGGQHGAGAAGGSNGGVSGNNGTDGLAGALGESGDFAGQGGNGLLINAESSTFFNLGNVVGGDNGGISTSGLNSNQFGNAIFVTANNSTIINAGTISAGSDGMAINYEPGTANATLELHGSSVINGLVNAANVTDATLTLGNSASASNTVFDLSTISDTQNNSSQFIGFHHFSLNGGSVWQLEGTTDVATNWIVTEDSTLSITAAENLGNGQNVTLNNGTLSLLSPIQTTQSLTVGGGVNNHINLSLNSMNSMAHVDGNGSPDSQITVNGGGQLSLLGNSSDYLGAINIGQNTTLQVGDGTAAQLGSGQVDIADGGLLLFNSSQAVTQTGALSGEGGLTQNGLGVLTLTAANSHTGHTTIGAGSTIAVNTGGALGAGQVDIANGGLLLFNSSQAVTQTGALSGEGGLTQNGLGVLTLTAANSHTGHTTIGAGSTIAVNTGGALGAGQVDIANGGLLTFNSDMAVMQSGVISGQGGVAQHGSGVLTLAALNTYTGGTFIGQGSTIAASSVEALGTGGITNNGTFIITNALNNAAPVLDQGMAGTGNTILGDSLGTMILAGDNSAFSGLLTVGTGTTIGVQTDLGTGNLLLLGDVSFDNGKDAVVSGTISGTGSVAVNSPQALTFSGINKYTGITDIGKGGTLLLSGAGSIATSSTVQLAEGALLVIKDTTSGTSVNNLVGQSGSQILLGDKTLTVNSDYDTTFNGNLTGSGGLTTAGPGTLTLTGQTQQTGSIAITAGALALDGSLGGAQLSSDIIGTFGAGLLLQNGATLTGTFNGASSLYAGLSNKSPFGSADISINNSRWTITGDSTVNNLTLAGGSINFSSVGPNSAAQYSTLTATNIFSQDSMISMHGGSTGSDKIVIDGGSVTGQAVIDYTLSSALTGPSITLVETLNGATTASDAFSLAKPVYFGASEYVLNQSLAANDYSWSLNKINSYRPEVVIDSTLTSTATGYIDALIGGINNALSSKRIGLLQEEKLGGESSFWVTGVANNDHENSSRYSKAYNNYKATVFGADTVVEFGAGYSAALGAFAAVGKGQSNYSRRYDQVKVGSSAADTYTVGLYALGNFGNGFYIDPVLQRSWLKSLKTSYSSGGGTETRASSWGLSVEGGKHIDLGNRLTITPHVNVDYQQLHMDGVQSHYADINFDRTKNLDVGAGINISKNIPLDAGLSLSVYAAPSIRQRLKSMGNTNYTWLDGASDYSTHNNTKGTSVPLTLGAIGHLTKDVTTSVVLDYESSGKSTAVSGTINFVYSF